MLPRFCWKKFRKLTEKQKKKIEASFCCQPYAKQSNYCLCGFRTSIGESSSQKILPPRLPLPNEEAEPISVEIFRQNPQFRDYRNLELR
ncbi:hypothetical protein B9Z55_025985 [Caenorhabditis nigoni]|uniref:Uncharacterized protein n=1 Tax=Caenorhabditis nigoni TaxID=1611254 RepID=A0A2G5T127_9PELO|nr:hypothetical protein B9Z55_025985 [Caenorhabditis nigoni]